MLRELTDPARLSRGRSYARSGQVMQLQVHPGRVTARVQGSSRTPYAVEIHFAPLSEAQWQRAERAMADQALFLAALLAGEMPRDIEQAFTAAGLSLFPTREAELQSDCSCPDWANPCKHVAATYYILAEAFDADPFLVFAWRGRTREALLERLRELRGAPEPESQAGEAAAAALPPVQSSAGFWEARPELARLRFTPRAAALPEALLRQLGPLPPAVPDTLHAQLSAAYRAIAAAAEQRAFGEG